jgi:hypothetical protein
VRLSGIFDDFQAAPLGQLTDRFHVGRLTVEMHRHDGACPRRNRLLDLVRLDGVHQLVGLDRNRNGAGPRYGQPRGDKGVGGHDHLVARSDSIPSQDQFQRVQSVADPDAVPHAAIRGELGFEGLDLPPQDVPARGHDSPTGGVQFLLQFTVGGLKIQKRNFHFWVSRTDRMKSG